MAWRPVFTIGGCIAVAMAGTASAQAPADLATRLAGGGYVLVMRHASSTPAAPDRTAAEPDNTALERQLDGAGRAQAKTFGDQVRRLRLPIRQVFVSTGYRARQTARLAGFADAMPVKFLADPMSQGATGLTTPADAASLRDLAGKAPARGSDTLIVTHIPNITAAFPEVGKGVEAGDVLVFLPGETGPTLVARVRIGDWATLAPAKR